MTITSSAFAHNERIPPKYTCDGENVSPPLAFSEVPKEAASFVLIMEDPDAPAKVFTHWVIYNMPPATLQILEGETPLKSVFGMTDFGTVGYGGPCPPSGTHRYFFKLFALDTTLDLPAGATKEEVQGAMNNHVIATAALIGLYARG